MEIKKWYLIIGIGVILGVAIVMLIGQKYDLGILSYNPQRLDAVTKEGKGSTTTSVELSPNYPLMGVEETSEFITYSYNDNWCRVSFTPKILEREYDDQGRDKLNDSKVLDNYVRHNTYSDRRGTYEYEVKPVSDISLSADTKVITGNVSAKLLLECNNDIRRDGNRLVSEEFIFDFSDLTREFSKPVVNETDDKILRYDVEKQKWDISFDASSRTTSQVNIELADGYNLELSDIFFFDPTVILNVSDSTFNTNNVTVENNFSHLSIGTDGIINSSNVVFYFPFTTNTSSTTAYDYSNGNNDGSLNGALIWVRAPDGSGGAYGGVYDFPTGDSDFINLGSDIDINGSHMTISAWAFSDASGEARIVSKATSTSEADHIWMMGILATGDRIRARLSTGGSVTTLLASTNSFLENRWNHAVFVYNSTDMILYVNAVEVGKTAKTGQIDMNNTIDVEIGRNPGGLGDFNGRIDEVMVLNISLNASQVVDLFHNQSNIYFPRGTQDFREINVSGDGTENRLNITLIDQFLFFGNENFTVQVGDSGAGDYTYGAEIDLGRFSNESNNHIISTPNNISVRLIFHSDTPDGFASPTAQNSLILDSFTAPGENDTTKPTVTLLIPTNGSTTNTNLTFFEASISDNINATNATLYVWNSSDFLLVTNNTIVSNASWLANLSFTLPIFDTYFWNYLAADNSSNAAFATSNFTLIFEAVAPEDTTKPTIVLTSPNNNSFFTENIFNISLNASISDDQNTIDTLIFGVNSTELGNLRKHGLLFKRLALANNTGIAYNWTAPVIIPDENTVALYHFDNNSDFFETDVLAYDFSNNNANNGTISGAFFNTTSSKFGWGLEFSGTGQDDHVQINTTNMNSSNFSISMWFIAKDFETSNQLFGHTTLPSFANRIQIYSEDAGGELAIGLGDTHAKSTIRNITTNRWFHIVMTLSDGNYVFYVDGQQNDSGTYTGLTSLAPTMDIGNNGDPGARAEAWNGTIDEVGIWNRSLSAIEVENLYRLKNATYIWRVNATDTSTNRNSNESVTRQFTIGAAVVADSCTYVAGNWDIACADACVITSPVNVGDNDIIITGSGTITFNSAVSNIDRFVKANTCTVVKRNGVELG